MLSPLVGVPVLAGSLAAIYLRGYLAPGAPAFTKRYFPDWFLAWFDKTPERREGTVDVGVDTDDQLDPEAVLSTVDAVEPCADEDDLCLTDSFATAWREECRRLRDPGARQDALTDLFETDSIRVQPGGGQVSVSDGDSRLAVWPSTSALVADLAADRVLISRAPDWGDLAPERRFGILAGLRTFLEACPLCDGPVELGEQTVDSCCRSWEVLSVHCTACDAGLLELDPETLETVA